MKVLYIKNDCGYHHEIVETLLNKYNEILKLENTNDIQIHLSIKNNDKEFFDYIKNKYKNVKLNIPKKYDYFIEGTFYEKDLPNIEKNSKNKFYISHRVNDNLQQYSNIFYLTPLAKKNYIYADILPFQNEPKIKTDYPIFVIQGNIELGRKDYGLLLDIIKNKHKIKKKFKIKVIGKLIHRFRFIEQNRDIFTIKPYLPFIKYHKEFLDCHCLITLTTKNKNPKYYKTTLTSNINYIRGYKLKALIDKDLQDIYNLPNVETYNGQSNFFETFKKIIDDF